MKTIITLLICFALFNMMSAQCLLEYSARRTITSSSGQAIESQDSLKLLQHPDTFLKTDDKSGEWWNVQSASLYGAGGIFSTLTGGDSIGGSTSAQGTIGLNVATKRLSTDVFFSLTGRQDLDVKNLESFGQVLMNPGLSGDALSFSVMGTLDKHWGFSLSYQVSNQLWAIDSTTRIRASPQFLRVGVYWSPFDFGEKYRDKIDLFFKAHVTHRMVLGDFSNDLRSIEGNDIIPRGYNGLDFSVNLHLKKSFEVFMQISQNGRGKFDIPGFTGTQVSFGVNVSAKVIDILDIKKDEECAKKLME